MNVLQSMFMMILLSGNGAMEKVMCFEIYVTIEINVINVYIEQHKYNEIVCILIIAFLFQIPGKTNMEMDKQKFIPKTGGYLKGMLRVMLSHALYSVDQYLSLLAYVLSHAQYIHFTYILIENYNSV